MPSDRERGTSLRPSILAGELPFALAVTIVYVALVAIGWLRHEMWRDEWQGWLIAKESGSLRELFARIRDESHLPLWPLCTYALSRIFQGPAALRILHGGLASASVFLVARHAPFPRWVRALFPFGYFFLFEYAIVTRNHAIAVLFLVLFCVTYPAGRFLPSVVLLLGFASSSHQGFLLAIPLLVLVARDPLARARKRIGLRILVPTFLVFAAGLVTFALLMGTVTKRGWDVYLATRLDGAKTVRTVDTVWNAFVPVPPLAATRTWNTNLLETYNAWRRLSPYPGLAMADPLRDGEWVAFLLSLGILAAGAISLRRARPVLLLYVTGSAILLLFTYVVYFGWMRQHGYLVLLFLACHWIARPPRDDAAGRRRPREAVSRLLVAVLVLQAAAGLIFYGLDLVLPFSPSRDVAEFIATKGLRTLPLIASPDYIGTAVSANLGEPFLSLATGKPAMSIRWTKRGQNDPKTVVRRLGRIFGSTEQPSGLVLTSFPIEAIARAQKPPPGEQDFQLTPIGVFPPGMVPDERYIVYFIQERGATVPQRIASLRVGPTTTY